MRKIKRLLKKIIIRYLKRKRKSLCKENGHDIQYRERWNKIKYYYCSKCKSTFNELAEDNYNTKCLVAGKMRKLPLIKNNILTVLVGIDNKIIKRHKFKDCVAII